jgi:hypothetical protein
MLDGRKYDWHGFALPASQVPIAVGQELHVETGKGNIVGVGALA